MLNSSFFSRFLLTAVFSACSVTAIQFDCKFEVSFAMGPGNRYTCRATINNSGSSFLESVTGVHLSIANNDDVEYLWIVQQNLTFVPKGIDNLFKNLVGLGIGSSPLKAISAEDLRPFPNLLVLFLNQNQLTSIDGDLFRYTKKLYYVTFESNPIQHIGRDLVTDVKSLVHLYFTNSSCVDERAYTQAQVSRLGARLPVLCPPLDVTTSE